MGARGMTAGEISAYYAGLFDEDLERLAQDTASLIPMAREALKIEMQRRSLPILNIDWEAEGAHETCLPYQWGKFQGWTMLLLGIVAFVINVITSDYLAGVLSALNAVTGFGIVHKYRFGAVLFFLQAIVIAACLGSLFFALIVKIIAYPNEPVRPVLVPLAFGACVSIIWQQVPAWLYYRKRWKEFRKGGW